VFIVRTNAGRMAALKKLENEKETGCDELPPELLKCTLLSVNHAC